MSSFSSSSFDAVIILTATDAVPADDVEAPTKDGSEEEAADGTARADGLLTPSPRRTEKRWSFLLIINITQQTTNRATDK